jgi:hypothetical protein
MSEITNAYSTSPGSPSSSNYIQNSGRKRQVMPNTPSYSPNETLNQMTQEVIETH